MNIKLVFVLKAQNQGILSHIFLKEVESHIMFEKNESLESHFAQERQNKTKQKL